MPAGTCSPDVPALEWCGVSKVFGTGWRETRLPALTDLNWRVPQGEIVGLLGPNGGGKSTAIKLMLGLLQPTAGTCRILGLPSNSTQARRVIGYVPELPQFPSHLTGGELVDFAAQLCGLPRPAQQGRVGFWLDRVGLAEAAHRRVGSYSRGMLQRVGLAQALVHEPEVIILDEPTSGMDPSGAEFILSLVRELKQQGRTVLLTSHSLADVESGCDHVAILSGGRLAYTGAVDADPGVGSFFVDPVPIGALPALEEWAGGFGATVEPRRGSGRLGRVYYDATRTE